MEAQEALMLRMMSERSKSITEATGAEHAGPAVTVESLGKLVNLQGNQLDELREQEIVNNSGMVALRARIDKINNALVKIHEFIEHSSGNFGGDVNSATHQALEQRLDNCRVSIGEVAGDLRADMVECREDLEGLIRDQTKQLHQLEDNVQQQHLSYLNQLAEAKQCSGLRYIAHILQRWQTAQCTWAIAQFRQHMHMHHTETLKLTALRHRELSQVVESENEAVSSEKPAEPSLNRAGEQAEHGQDRDRLSELEARVAGLASAISLKAEESTVMAIESTTVVSSTAAARKLSGILCWQLAEC